MLAEPHVEVEIKIALVNWRDFDRLIRALPAPETRYIQTNSYLDDEDKSLREARIMLRARETRFPPGGAKGLGKPPVTITAKRRRSAKDGVFISDEREEVWQKDVWDDYVIGRIPLDTSGPVFDWVREKANFGQLRIIGQTVNERCVIRSDVFMLEIDKTRFPDDSIEVEIECESIVPEQARQHILELCQGLGIETRSQTLGKYARFLAKSGI